MKELVSVLLVGAGGAAGSVARYVTQLYVERSPLAGPWPWATLLVNAVGSLLLGALLGALGPAPEGAALRWKLLLGTGVMGGFTTYSTYNAEVLAFFSRGESWLGAAYMMTTLVTCLAFGTAGLLIGRALGGAPG